MRNAAGVALALGAGALLMFMHQLGEGPFSGPPARHLRRMKDRVEAPRRIEPTSLAAMAALPHGRLPAEVDSIERHAVSLEGYVQHVMHATDGDIHLEIIDHPVAAGGWDSAYVSAEITPRVRGTGAGWNYERLIERLRPLIGGVTAWADSARRVRITGWLLYDWQYDNPPQPGRSPMRSPRLTGWEIHPVTRIEIWNADSSGFEDLPR